MNIREAKEEIKNTLRAYHRRDGEGNYVYPLVRQRPVLLMGPPGIGKTAIMEQIVREQGVGLVSYTITHHTRQSAIGLPKIVTRSYQGQEMSVTEYTLSEIVASVYDCMERTEKREGILFIDEINCVSETLAPVMLQFLQNKTFGNHRIPEGWLIVAAGNPPEYNKSVREFDIVTLDRVRVIPVEADCQVWMEYAWQREVHGAVLSYLSLKKHHFYMVEQTAEGKAFVTARGWEDLSEILKGYEELGAPVTEKLVIQYLQKEEVAREFGAYYRLYQKYGTDYGVREILDGGLSSREYEAKVEMARRAPFEERFTVVGLLLAGLGLDFGEFQRMDQRTVLLHEKLTQLKRCWSLSGKTNGKEMREVPEPDPRERERSTPRRREEGSMEAFLRECRRKLEVRRRMELITEQEARLEEAVIRCLDGYRLVLLEEHIPEGPEGFERIKELFSRETRERAEQIRRLQDRLSRAFRFGEDCFGEDQEMILLVSGLTRNRRAVEFIGNHGCREYFRFSHLLLGQETEEELRAACREALRDIEEPHSSGARI